MRRRLGVIVAAAVALVAVVILLVHTPFVRMRALRYALARVEADYGIRVTASRLDYNLFSLRAGLADVRVSAAGKTPPFFEAAYVAVAVPLRTLGGDVVFDAVEVRDGAVTVVRTASGGTNLPESAGAPESGEPAPLRIARLTVSPLRIAYRDAESGVGLDVPGATVQLSARDGRIALTEPATVTAGSRSTRITALAGDARFDGRSLQLSELRLDAPEGAARVDGTVRLIASEPSLDLRIAGTGDAAQLARWGLEPAQAPQGQIAFDVHLEGPMSRPAAGVTASSPRLALEQVTLTSVAVKARITAGLLDVSEARAAFPGGTIGGSARVPFGGDPAASAVVTLTNALTPFAPLPLPGESRLSIAAGRWRLDGRHRIGGVAPATLALRGTIAANVADSPIAGSVQLSDTDVAALRAALRRADLLDIPGDAAPSGVVRGEARLTGTVSRTRVAFTAASDALRVAAANAAGPATASGTYDTGGGRYTFDVALPGWTFAASEDIPLSGRADASFRGSGAGAAVNASGSVTARDVVWQSLAIGDVDATVDVDPQAAHLAARAPRFNADVDARTGIRAPYMTSLTAHVESLALAPLLAGIETPVALDGAVSAVVRAEGPLAAWRDGAAELEVTRLDATAGELPIRLLEPARLRYRGEQLLVDRFEAEAGATHLSAAGGLGTTRATPNDIVLTLTGDAGDLAGAIRATGIAGVPVVGGEGPVALLARVGGSLEAPVITADAEIGPGAIMLPGLPAIRDLRLRAHVEDGWVEVRDAHGSYQGAMIDATGRAPLSLVGAAAVTAAPGEASVRARMTGITAMVLQPFMDSSAAEEISGSLDATLTLDSPSLDVTAVRGALEIDRLDLRVADVPVTQRVPTRIVAGGGFARVEAWDWTGQGATLGVRGQVRLDDLQTAILANGELDLRMVTPFVRDAGLAAQGTLQPRLSITGALTDPRIDGDLLVADAELRLTNPRVIVSDLNGRAILTRSAATLAAMTGSINGGALTIEGGAELQADATVRAQLAGRIRQMALEFPAGLRSELDGTLQLRLATAAAGAPPDGRVEGTVTILQGSYRQPLAVVTGLLANLRSARVAATVEAPGALDRIGLDIRVITDEDITVDNNYGQFALGADLRLIGTLAVPALSGRAELREGGRLFVGRNTYTITSGTIDFSNPAAIEPIVNIQLTTRTAGVDVELTIAGPAENLSVDLRSPSDPDLGQADLTSLLVAGRRLDELNADDATLIGAQVLGNLSADVLGFAGRTLGLDTLRIGGVETSGVLADPTALTTNIDPTQRLTFGKALGRGVDVTFSQSLRDGDKQTWIIEYLPSRHLELRFVSNDEDLRSYAFRHDVSIGGARRAPAEASAPARSDVRVAAVRIEGEMLVPEPQLRRLLSLTEGDRFDFGEWQRDRDRILASLQQQGHARARVGAARMESDAGVTLAYTVAAGPRTEIVVTGATLPAPAMAELRAAWSDAVVDAFLLDEAKAIAAGALAREGYLQPAVVTRIDRSDGVETLAIQIDAGQRASRVTIRLQGTDEMLADELTSFIGAQRLSDRAATEPASVASELTGYLRGLGYLGARVTAGPPLFEGDEAVVPMTVAAGPFATVGDVRFERATAFTAMQLRETAALVEGRAAAPAAIEAARQRLVALYRREGYASAAVTASQTPHPGEPRLDVTFVIAEGPRQVLASIVISGNRSIDTDVIERELRLQVNQPLRPEEWLQARTRLFGTALFRRVDVAAEPAAEAPSSDGTLPMRMRVTVEEWPVLRARYGLQLAEEFAADRLDGRDLLPGLAGDVTRRTLFGRAVTVGGAAAWQRRQRLGRLFLNAPTMFSVPLQSSFILERAHRNFADATLVTETSSVAWEQRFRATPRLNLSYAYRFERNHTFDTEPDVAFPFDIRVNVARLTGSAALDSRDDPVDAARGSLVSTSFEFASTRLGSDITYVRSLTQAYYFRPWRGVVLASAARAGVVAALGGQEVIPSVRFFAGGGRTLRGVEEDSLGELNFFGDPVGGEGLLVLNQEARFPIYRWLRGVAFVDAANVQPDPRIRFKDTVTSTGVGVRLMTPIGVLRADYGRVLFGPHPSGSGRFTFGLGQAF